MKNTGTFYSATIGNALAAWTLPALLARHRVWTLCATAFAVLTVIFLALSAFDQRLFNGVSVWVKPFKFALSLGVYFVTLAWFAPLLPAGYFSTWRGRAMTWLPVASAAFEIAYIAFQAGQGEASHFNETSAWHSLMYKLMGAGAVALVAICLWMGGAILRHRGISNPYVLAVALGLILTFFLGGILGGYLSSQPAHWVGGVASDSDGLWFFKWARDGGDLRVAHFFGIHAMQVLPLLALPVARQRSRSAVAWVLLVAVVYAALTLGTFLQAIAGRPFFS